MKISFFVIFAIYFASLVGNSSSNPVMDPVDDAQAADHQVADPKIASPQVAGHQVVGHQVADHKVADNQVADHQVADPQVAEHQVADTQVAVQTTQFVDPYAAGSFPTWDWTVLSDGPF